MTDIAGPLAGGALIGLAAAGLLVLTGKTAGVSGVVEGIVRLEKGELGWKLAFAAGLVAGGVGMLVWRPELFPGPPGAPLWIVIVGGLLVGLGTRVGGGCTSGHGVCGIGKGSRRAIVATLVFMAAGMLTVLARRLA